MSPSNSPTTPEEHRPLDVIKCILAVTNDVLVKYVGGHDGLIGRSQPIHHSGIVSLSFSPNSEMMWSTWGLALTAMAGLVNGNEVVGFGFRVFVSQNLVGSGALRG